ncbi:OmpW/AlkL family protein [Sphingobium nicotianae]|nr:OmpW family outer membrane protein [Sphingobium nicotianae]
MAAHAGAPDGKIQVKLLGTAVLPDGGISTVRATSLALPAKTDTSANDNYVPTVAIEYFLSNAVSVETICCTTSHHVDGAGAIAGVTHLIDDILIVPATVTLKYHLTGLGPVKPYVGAGPSYFLVLDSKIGAGGKAALGATDASLKSKLGFALQAGVDIPVGGNGFGVSLDAKRYFMRPLARFSNAAGATLLETRHELDPWVLSAGLSYRF